MKKQLQSYVFLLFFFSTLLTAQTGEMLAWGAQPGNGAGQSGTPINPTMPVGVSNLWKSVAGGSRYSVAIKNDGTLWAWGGNEYGELGDGTLIDKNTPVQISAATNWSQIACGYRHTIAIKTDGTIYSWGNNEFGVLGNGSVGGITNAITQIPSFSSSVVQVVAGSASVLVLLADGTVKAWGQFHDGTNWIETANPVTVSGLSGVTQIATNGHISLGLKSDGTILAWGINVYGTLGNGTNTATPGKVTVLGINNAIKIATGGGSCYALLADKTVKSWGLNENGQLGDGTTTNRNTPVTITGLSQVTQIAAGSIHALAIQENGDIKAWGGSYFNALGIGSSFSSTPANVLNITATLNSRVFAGTQSITSYAIIGCLVPTSLMATNIGTSATLAWAADGSAAWDIYFAPDAATIPNSTTIPSVSGHTSTSYTFTANPSLTYRAYVRASCSATQKSGWSEVLQFSLPVGFSSRSLNGKNQYAKTTGNLLNGATTWTMECWIKTSECRQSGTYWQNPTIMGAHTNGNNSGDFAIVSQNGLLGMWAGLTGSATDNSFFSTFRINDNVWHHVAASCDGAIIRLFGDGVQLGSFAATLPLNTSSSEICIGSSTDLNAGTGNYFHQGDYDEIRFSNISRYTNTNPPSVSTPVFTLDANTMALFHVASTECAAFTDASVGNHPATLYNMNCNGTDPTCNYTRPDAGSSYTLNGTNQYARTACNLLDGASIWTMECWIKTTESRSGGAFYEHPTIMGVGLDGCSPGDFGIFTAFGKVGMWAGVNTSCNNYYWSNFILNDNAWHHIAASSNGTTVKLFADGVLLGSIPISGTLLTGTFEISVGALTHWQSNVGAYFHQGSYDEIRFSKVARYSADFTPQPRTSPFTSDGQTAALFHANDTDTEDWDDASLGNHPAKLFNIACGNVNSCAYTQPDAGVSYTMNGVNQYARTSGSLLNNKNVWTMECWIKTVEDRTGDYFYSHPTLMGFGLDGCSPGDFGIFSANGKLGMWGGHVSNCANYVSSTFTLNDNVWHHVAASCNGTEVKLFADGQLVNTMSATSNTLLTSGFEISIGALTHWITNQGDFFHQGSYDEIRFSNVARYSTNFTPQPRTTPFTLDAQTEALFHADDTDANNLDDATGAHTAELFNVCSNPNIQINLKVYLQGAYNAANATAGKMNDNLRSLSLIPTTEPYTGMSNFTHVGGGGSETTTPSVLNATGDNAIVDWVFLEFRNTSATPTTVLFTKAALLQRDGDIVDVDGVTPLQIPASKTDLYHIAVRHRNHLGVRTDAIQRLKAYSPTTIDFTSNLAIAKATPVGTAYNALATVETGKYALWGGNTNGDGIVRRSGTTTNDYGLFLNYLGGASSILNVYRREDFNLDGRVSRTGVSTNDYAKFLGYLGSNLSISQPTF